jgi:hypothetical protein
LICVKFPSERQIEWLLELDEPERESAELSGAILSQHIVADSNPRNRNREKSAISLPVGTTEYAAR